MQQQSVARVLSVTTRNAPGILPQDGSRTPREVRGVFSVYPSSNKRAGVRLREIEDGTSNTFGIGDDTGGTPLCLVRDLPNPSSSPRRRHFVALGGHGSDFIDLLQAHDLTLLAN